ncbi:MAG: DinB family protein [Ignavibacteriae bacterium]|nr:DinB family protein [Ignavibacteriota bacterium]
MITRKDILLQQMHACFDEETWFVTLKNALDGLTPENAAWKSGGNHSIHEIVNHLIFWNQRYLNRFINVPVEEIKDNEYTFTNDATGSHVDSWKATVEKVYDVFSEWCTQLDEALDTKLEGIPIKGYPDTWFTVIANINIHNAYHIGQIVTLRKEQGSWSPDRGVK